MVRRLLAASFLFFGNISHKGTLVVVSKLEDDVLDRREDDVIEGRDVDELVRVDLSRGD